jgi:hypothetical protein
MRIICGHAVILMVALSPVSAEDRRPPSEDRATAPDATAMSPPSAPSTGKERLGGKWTDEQRTDNCRVPVDKRGTRPRPDTCVDDPASRDAREGR